MIICDPNFPWGPALMGWLPPIIIPIVRDVSLHACAACRAFLLSLQIRGGLNLAKAQGGLKICQNPQSRCRCAQLDAGYALVCCTTLETSWARSSGGGGKFCLYRRTTTHPPFSQPGPMMLKFGIRVADGTLCPCKRSHTPTIYVRSKVTLLLPSWDLCQNCAQGWAKPAGRDVSQAEAYSCAWSRPCSA